MKSPIRDSRSSARSPRGGGRYSLNTVIGSIRVARSAGNKPARIAASKEYGQMTLFRIDLLWDLRDLLFKTTYLRSPCEPSDRTQAYRHPKHAGPGIGHRRASDRQSCAS